MTYGAHEDIAVRYVLELIDKGSAQLLEKDRSIRRSTGETTNVMRRQAEQAVTDSHKITSAADTSARAYMRTGSSSLEAAGRQREASSMNVTAMERTAVAAEEMEHRAARSFRQTAAHARQTHGPLRELARAGAALGGVYLGYEHAKGAIEDTLGLAKSTKRLSDATGLAVGTSSALLSATRARGIVDSKLETSLGILATRTDQVAHGTDKQRRAIAGLNSVAHSFTGRQRALAEEALIATRGSNRQVQALTLLKKSLADEADAHARARAGRQAATLSQARQYTMTRAQIAAWHDQQSALAAGDRQAEVVANQTRKRQSQAITDALTQASSTNAQAEAFHRLGISQAEIQRGAHDMHFLLGRVAAGFNELGAGVDKVALSRQLFGRGSAQLMPIIGSYQEQIKLAKDYGATLDGHTIKSLEQMEEAQRKVKLSNTALKLSFTQAVQPALLSLAHTTSDVTRAWSDPKLTTFDQRMEATAKGLEKLHIGEHLGKAIEVGLPIIARSAAKAAPVILGAIGHGFAHAGLVGDAVILAWAAKKLGLWSTLGRTAGKAFFAKFFETEAAGGILARFGLGTGDVAGRRGVSAKVTGLLGATPETPMWVRVAGPGIPVGGGGGGSTSTIVKDAEKVGGGAGAAALARTLAARALPIAGGAVAGYEFGSWASRAAGFDEANGTMRRDVSKNFGLQRSASGLAQAWGFINRGGTDDPNKQLNEFGDKIHDIGDGLRDLPVSKLAALRAEALKFATVASGASADEITALHKFADATDSVLTGRVKGTLQQTEGNFEAMRISTRGHLKDITAATRDNMTTIANTLGTKSRAGKTALAQNFMDAAGEIQHAMDVGKLSTQTGLAEIDKLLSRRLEVYGFSKADAHRFNQTTNVESTRGHAMGGYVDHAGARGTDRVHAVLGAGESVSTIHQQREINQGLAIARAATGGRYRWGHLNDIYNNVTSRHSDAAAYATGGIVSQVSLAGVHPGVLAAGRAIESRFPGLTVTSGTGGTHATHSYHYLGEALDIASGDYGLMNRAAAWINTSSLAGKLTEGIHNPGLSIKFGKHVDPSYWGATTWAGHADHIHIAVTGGLGNLRIRGPASAIAAAGTADRPWRSIPGVHTGMPGMLGHVVQGALNLAHAAANQAGHKLVADGGGGAGLPGSSYRGPLDRIFPAHFLENGAGHARLSPRQVATIARSVGLPGSTFEKIAHGESQYYPGVVQHDPGDGNIGYGLWQITPHAWGDDPGLLRSLRRLGGIAGMRNPIHNAQMAKILYDAAGGIGPWHGTAYLNRGGYAWGGFQANGGDYTVNKPTVFVAGENGPEHASFRPMAQGGPTGTLKQWTSGLLSGNHDLQRSSTIHRQALAGFGDVVDHAAVDVANAAALRIRDALARIPKGDLRIPLLHHALGDVDDAMYARAKTWIRGFASAGLGAHAKHVTATRLDQLPTALANVTYGELGKLATSIRRQAAGLSLSDRHYRNVAGRADAIAQSLDTARAHTKAARATLAHDSKAGESQATKDADQARIDADKRREDALVAEEKTAKKRVDALKKSQQRTTARLGALHSAAAAVHTAQGNAIDLAAAHAEQVAGGADRIETATDRRLRRKGIDPSSSRGLAAQAADSAKEINKIQLGRTLLEQQLKRAEQLGDRGRVSQIRQQLAQTTDDLAERRTQQIERERDLARHRLQDKVDTVEFGASRADVGLQRLQISQQLLGTAGTAGGGQQIAEYIRKTIEPLDDKRIQTLTDKLKELQAEPTPDAQLIRDTILERDNAQAKRDQDQLDAQNAVKEAVTDLKDFGGGLVISYHGQDELDAVGGGAGL